MQFNKQRGSQLPQVNLVPMMDVLMTVLTFFIIISMTLRGQQVMNISLPTGNPAAESADKEAPAEALIVGLNQEKQILVENQPVTVERLAELMQTYLTDNPEAVVLLKADRELTYDDVAEVLETMRDIGGDRVSLAIDQTRN